MVTKRSYRTKSLDENADFLNDVLNNSQDLSNKLIMKALFYKVDWVYILVDLVAKEFASVIPSIYSKEINNSKEVYKPNDRHPLKKLLDNPQKDFDPNAFYYSIAADLVLGGDSYAWYARANEKFMYIPNQHIMIYENKYVANIAKNIEISKDDMLRLKFPSLTFDTPYGLSPFVAGYGCTQFSKDCQDYLNAYFRKGALPQVILETDVSGSLETLKVLKRTFENEYTGKAKQRNILVLPKGVKANVFDSKIADQQIKDLLDQNREKIINLLHVPKHALSLQETGSLGSQEHKQALKYFWQSTIISLHKKFTAALNQVLKQELQGSIIDYDYSNVEILKDDLLAKADLATKMLTTKTVNEVRKEVWELDPLPGGDSLPSQGQPAQPTQPQFQLPQQTGATPVTPTEPIGEIQNNATTFKYAIETHKDFSTKKTEHDRIIFTEGENTHDEFKKFIEEFLIEQAEIAVKLLRSEKAKFDEKSYIERLQKELLEREDTFRQQYLEVLQPNLSRGYQSQLELVFNAPNREAIAALRARTAGGEVAILNARGLDTFANLTDTTTKKISSIVAESFAANLSVTEVANSLIDKISSLTPSRAKTIARTETLTAVSIGQAGALKNAQRVMPDAVKVWITADDERVRGRPGGLYEDAAFNHWELHGDAVPLNAKFANGLSHPRDVTGDAGNVINCVTGDTLVSANNIKKIYRRIYNGNIIIFKTASGKMLSVTPKHPILTNKGWLPAAQVAKGDQFVNCVFGNTRPIDNNNLNIMPTPIHEVFDSFRELCMVTHSASANFHGDITDGDVDIIDVDGILRKGLEPLFSKTLDQINFKSADPDPRDKLSLSRVDQTLDLSRFSCGSEMTISDLVNPFVFGHSTPFNSLGFRSSPNSDTSFFEVSYNNNPWNIEHFRDFIHASNIVDVFFDPVIDISFSVFASHVYNLETKNNLYIANNLINHNCRCSYSIVAKEDLADFRS